MDSIIRSKQRAMMQDPEQEVAWLRAKIRQGEIAEGMKRILCALGYEPMVLALGYPAKPQKAVSFMVQGTYCKYKNGQWHKSFDYNKIGHYLCKRGWMRRLTFDVLQASPLLTLRKSSGYIVSMRIMNKEVRDDLITALLKRLK